jgi:hypothetical protein
MRVAHDGLRRLGADRLSVGQVRFPPVGPAAVKPHCDADDGGVATAVALLRRRPGTACRSSTGVPDECVAVGDYVLNKDRHNGRGGA